jgi:hypothetical protein
MIEKKAETLNAAGIKLYSIYRDVYKKYLHYANLQSFSNEEKFNICLNLLKYELDWLLDEVIDDKLRTEGKDFSSYLPPLTFLLFIYFAGFLITIPLITSVFTEHIHRLFIPLTPIFFIPFSIMQWGFLGGLVYTSLYLLNRFLRKDLLPRVYLYASFRLLLSIVVAVIIYFLYLVQPITYEKTVPPSILLSSFLAGVAPIQFLYSLADTQLAKITGWKRRNVAGNRPITLLDGINSINSERLKEEGINSVQEMALCNPLDISIKTEFVREIVTDCFVA